MSDADISITVQSIDEVRTLLGPLDCNARLIRELHGISVLARDGSIRLLGEIEHATIVQSVLKECLRRMRTGHRVSTQEVATEIRKTIGMVSDESEAVTERPVRPAGSGVVRARTEGQQHYLDMIDKHDVVFGVGPAGTGKTYLAVAKAIQAMKEGGVRRLVLVRRQSKPERNSASYQAISRPRSTHICVPFTTLFLTYSILGQGIAGSRAKL